MLFTKRTMLSTISSLVFSQSIIDVGEKNNFSYITIQSTGVFSLYYTGDIDTLDYIEGLTLEIEQPYSSTTVQIAHQEAEIEDGWYVLETEVGEGRVSELYIHSSTGSYPIQQLPETDVSREHWFYFSIDSDGDSTVPDSETPINGTVETREAGYINTNVENTVWVEWDADDELKTLLEHSAVRMLTYEGIELLGYFELRDTASSGINRCPSMNHSVEYTDEKYFVLLDIPNHDLALEKDIVLRTSNVSLQNITADVALTGTHQQDRADDLAQHRVEVLQSKGDTQ